MEFYGLLTFSEGLLFKKEVLGRSFDTKIAGIDISICFPCYCSGKDQRKSEDLSCPLEAQNRKVKLKRNGDKINWGYPNILPSGNSVVYAVMVIAYCKDKEEVEEVSQKLYSAIKQWERSFVDYICLCTKQSVGGLIYTDSSNCRLELFDDKYINNHSHKFVFNMYLHSKDEYLSIKQVEEALSFATSNKELLLEYQMLLSAYKAKNVEQYRQAVVDACSAVEICLNNQIEKYCQKKELDSDILFKKYWSLGDKFSLIMKIDNQFNISNPFDRIVSPRNKVVHKNEFPDAKTTWDLLIAVEECLKLYNTYYY